MLVRTLTACGATIGAASCWFSAARSIRRQSHQHDVIVNNVPHQGTMGDTLPYGGGVEAVLALLALAAVWVISRRSALTIGATAAVIGGLLVSHHAYVYDAALLLPACALVLRLPAPKALRYGALLLCVPIPYVLLMQEHGAWVVAQLSINGFGMLLLGLLAFHGLRVSARTQPVVHGVAAGDGLRFY